MADTVCVYWFYTEPKGTEPTWWAYVEGLTDQHLLLFLSTNRDEFFARYNALTVTKEPAPTDKV